MTREKNPEVYLDIDMFDVYVEGEVVEPIFSKRQWDMLYRLWQSRNRVVTRDQLAEATWPDEVTEGVSEQAIDALVRRIRLRLQDYTDMEVIETIRGHGFRLRTSVILERNGS